MTKNIDIKKIIIINQDISIYIISNSIFKGEKHHHKNQQQQQKLNIV